MYIYIYIHYIQRLLVSPICSSTYRGIEKIMTRQTPTYTTKRCTTQIHDCINLKMCVCVCVCVLVCA